MVLFCHARIGPELFLKIERMAKKKKQQATRSFTPNKWHVIGGLVLLVLAGVLAYKTYYKQPDMLVQLTDAEAEAYAVEVRSLLPKLVRADGSMMGEETAEEKKLPIVSLEVVKRTINTGVVSVMAEHCQLDWEKNYRAFMYHYRHDQQYTDKQMAFLGVLHGFAMGKFGDGLALECSAEDKAAILSHFFK